MNFEHIIREHEGKVIGDLEWRESPGGTYELHLDVEPEFHRQGIGRSMVEELERLVLKKKATRSLYSFAAEENEGAHMFFMGVGFRGYKIANFYGRNAYFWVKPLRG